MASALVGMGSNIEPARWLAHAANRLVALFGAVRFSRVYETEAVGMDGPPFWNACAWIEDAPPPAVLVPQLKAIEDEAGRDRSRGSWQPRTLDLDLLVYDGKVLDADLRRYLHLWLPARDVWPDLPFARPKGRAKVLAFRLAGLQNRADGVS